MVEKWQKTLFWAVSTFVASPESQTPRLEHKNNGQGKVIRVSFTKLDSVLILITSHAAAYFVILSKFPYTRDVWSIEQKENNFYLKNVMQIMQN